MAINGLAKSEQIIFLHTVVIYAGPAFLIEIQILLYKKNPRKYIFRNN